MSCYSKQILDLFYNIQNTGRIIKPEAIGRAGSKAEGTVIEFSWRVEEGIIKDARFRTFGDVNAIVISSLVTTMIIGKSVEEALLIRAEDILEHLFNSQPNHLYLTDLSLLALANTYENYLKKNAKVERKESEIAKQLREDIESIEAGNLAVEDNLDLASMLNLEQEEQEYLNNLNSYNKMLEDNSIEKSIESLFNSKPVNTVPVEKVSKGRGRPRKERTTEELEALANKVKRGRGRPRKELTEEDRLALENKVKRGRGRPRKDTTNFEPIKAESTTQESKSEFKPEYSYTKPINYSSSIEEDEALDEEDFGVDIFSSFSFNNKKTDKVEATPILNEDREEDNISSNNESLINSEPIYPTITENVVRGRGRPRKYPIEEKIEQIGEKRGRGRPRKERTEEELLELQNKVKKGRGRPRKERTPEELEAMANKVSRGRGRPRKEITEEERLALENKVKRGRGRPRKDTAIFIQNIRPVATEGNKPEEENIELKEEVKQQIEEKVADNVTEEKAIKSSFEEKPVAEDQVKEVEVEMTNNFAPANNKYGIGRPATPYYTNTTTTTIKKVETKTGYYSNVKESYNIVKEETSVGGGKEVSRVELHNEETKPINNIEDNVKDLLSDDSEPKNIQPLSDNVSSILQKGGSIEDALKYLMDN